MYCKDFNCTKWTNEGQMPIEVERRQELKLGFLMRKGILHFGRTSTKLYSFIPSFHNSSKPSGAYQKRNIPKNTQSTRSCFSMKSTTCILVYVSLSFAVAWEFPRLAVFDLQPGQDVISADNDRHVDIITGSQFHGLKTFANVPYVNCFSDQEAAAKKYDIAILGAPFDTVRPHPAPLKTRAHLM